MEDLFGSDSENEKEPSSAPSDSDAASKSEQSSSEEEEIEENEDNEEETVQKRPAKKQMHEDLFGSDSDDGQKPGYTSEPEEHEKNASADEGGSSPAASAASSTRAERLGTTQEDLFGEDVDDVSSSSGDEKRRIRRQEMEQDDDDADREEPVEEVPETMINAEIPKISTNLGREMHFVRLPNFLSVEPRPFHPDLYEDEIDEDEVLDEEGKARLKLKVENTIRWRRVQNEFGDWIKESNARIVRWSDGSLSLHLGNEIFDVYKTPVQGDCNHLFIRQGTGLQGQAVFKTKLSFRPHSTDSLTHRKMTLSLADKTNKIQKIRILAELGKDPESHRQDMIKKEEERLRAQQRRESMQRRIREKSGTRSLTTSMLEQDESDEDTSLNAIKKQVHDRFKQGRKSASQSIYTDSESELEDRLNKAKGGFDSDEEKGKTKKRRAMVVEESDDDDEEL